MCVADKSNCNRQSACDWCSRVRLAQNIRESVLSPASPAHPWSSPPWAPHSDSASAPPGYHCWRSSAQVGPRANSARTRIHPRSRSTWRSICPGPYLQSRLDEWRRRHRPTIFYYRSVRRAAVSRHAPPIGRKVSAWGVNHAVRSRDLRLASSRRLSNLFIYDLRPLDWSSNGPVCFLIFLQLSAAGGMLAPAERSSGGAGI